MSGQIHLRNVLLPVDFSTGNLDGLQYAISLCSYSQATLHILITYRLIGTDQSLENGELRRGLEERAREKRAYIESQLQDAKQVNVLFHTEIGFLFERIRKNIKKLEIDLLVFDEQMESLLDQPSEETGDARKASFGCPVLFVPVNKNPEPDVLS